MSALAAAEEYLTLVQELERGKFDVRQACTPVGHGATGDVHVKQMAAVVDQSRFIVACLPRRSGKTMFEAIRAVLMCLAKPNAVVWYLSFTISYGVDTFTDGCLRGLLKRFGVAATIQEGGAYVEFPNGSQITIRGIDDLHSVEKLRGRNPPDLVFLDECFPAGTLIDGRPIESIRIGDVVACVDHVTGRLVSRRVVGTFSKTVVDYLVSVRLPPCGFTSTATHPVFAKGRGYVHARDLVPGDLLCVRRRLSLAERQSRQGDVLGGVQLQDARGEAHRDARAHADVAGGDRGLDASAQPDAQFAHAREGVTNAQALGFQAPNTWGEWARSDEGRVGVGHVSWLGVERSGQRQATAVGVSDLLQAGPGGSSIDDVYRGRWSEPCVAGAAESGCEEDNILEWARVESVSRDEPTGAHGTTVYNLEVEGAHTYFANDVLVHNCQSMRERILQPVVDNIIRPTLLDRAGTLIVTGTPSPVPAGFFYKIWTEGKWSRHHWSLFDNPSKSRSYYEAFLAKEREDRGITDADPAYRREWLGEWAIEENLRVYKYGPLNDVPATREEFSLKNGITGTKVIARHHLMSAHQAPLWRQAVGIDIGSGDRTSIVVLGQHLHDQHVFERYEWTIHRKQEPVQSDVVAQLRFIQREYNPMHYFFDSGGAGGKLFMTTLQRDYGFPFVEAARKTDRRGQIDSVNTWFRKGLLLVPAVSLAAEDAMRTIWDADKLKTGVWEYSGTWHPDPIEALRYCATGIYSSWFEQKNLKSQRQRMLEAETSAVDAELNEPARGGLVQGEITDMLEAEDHEAFGQGGWTGW